MTEWTLEDIAALSESTDFEAKLAGGRDGRGELPQDIKPTYSAMANTRGGTVCLGLRQLDDEHFEAVGIRNPDRVVKQLWDTLHDRDQVSANVLSLGDVEVITVDGNLLVLVQIPRARRGDRPVFVGKNPLDGTYIRRHEGDYKCERERVERMLAERSQDSLDGQILERYGLDDLVQQTLRDYRQRFQNRDAEHVWNGLEDKEFLRVLGGWGKDRETGAEGLTLAGLLMFGNSTSILDVLPRYHVDYRERQEAGGDTRWDDRLIPDGTWSGNLFDFYLEVARRLVRGLRVPFRLKGDTRQDDTPAHEALREALVNTLIHADHRGSTQLVVEKYPDRFVFRNPGTMRVPMENALLGGDSDCRNLGLQRMFRMVGLGEQAGSGIPKIYQNWKGQTWRTPSLTEDFQRDQTKLELRMVSLLPEATLDRLGRLFGERFHKLTDPERIILGTADVEGVVTHARLREVIDIHSADLSKLLRKLGDNEFLVPEGQTRARSYTLTSPKKKQPLPLFPERGGSLNGTGSEQTETGSEQTETGSEQTGTRSEQTRTGSEQTATGSEQTATGSEQVTTGSEQTATGSEQRATGSEQTEVPARVATPEALEKIRDAKRVPKHLLELVLLDLCAMKPRSLVELSRLLGRKPDSLRVHFTRRLVKTGLLRLQYPDRLHHPDQEYLTVVEGKGSTS